MLDSEKLKFPDSSSLLLKAFLAIAGLSMLAWIGTQNYLLFHCLTELSSVIVAAALFIVAWNVRDTIENGYLLFLGIALLFISVIDLIHTLAYNGMGVFPGHNANLPTQLWIAARGMESVTLLCAPIFLTRKVRPTRVFAAYAVLLGCIFLSIFSWRIFPVCYIDGYGLTGFKIAAEYGISLILVIAMIELLIFRRRFPRPILGCLCFSISATILSELAFTQYVGVYGNFNALGHLLKVVSVGFIYKAIVETGFRRPYELIYRSLAESERKFRSVVESNVIGVVFADLISGEVAEANDEYLRIVGRTRAELDAGLINWKAMTPPEVLAKEEVAIGALVGGEEKMATLEKVYVRPDGSSVSAIIGGAFLDESRQRAVAFVLDNTARKRDEELVREAKERAEIMAEALKKSNHELEQFGYIISHDLQEPLRTISGFLGLLKGRQSSLPEEKANQYIDFAMEASSRMSQMIRDLLEYSRVGRQNRPLDVVDINEVFKEACANCVASIREAEATVTCGDMPPVMGDRQHLVQLFQNLIGNSVKFRRTGVLPQIHISATREKEYWVFKIHDNGIGIEKDQIDRLFVLFRRLHGRNVYGGTGIGLALCKKIVELHGGQIWIESEPGIRTEVGFTLRATPNN